jgi:hypothetical protein
MAKATHDWKTLDPHIDHLKAQGWNDTQIAKDLGIAAKPLSTISAAASLAHRQHT